MTNSVARLHRLEGLLAPVEWADLGQVLDEEALWDQQGVMLGDLPSSLLVLIKLSLTLLNVCICVYLLPRTSIPFLCFSAAYG